MQNLVSLLAGVLFSVGLGVAGMTKPSKIQGFLDIFGEWQPELIFVMAGAVAIYASFFIMVTKRKKPVLGDKFFVPTNNVVDKKLLIGAAIFGAGWGWGGFCPGPAVTAMGSGDRAAILFVFFMVLGMLLFKFYERLVINKGVAK